VLLAWAVSCDSYELRENTTADIFGAGIDTFYVDDLPSDLDVTILVRLLLTEGERTALQLQMLAPDTVPLGTLTFDVDAEPGPNHREGFIVSQIEVLRAGFRAETEGVYSAEIFAMDGRGDPTSEERRRSIFFNVRPMAEAT
jgi:hypothetical protein